MATRWQVPKRAVETATMRVMAGAARSMATASERALTTATKRAMETEGEEKWQR